MQLTTKSNLLSANVTFEYEQVKCTEDSPHYLMLSLKCPKIESTKRAPIDLICTIDKSGSMSGKNIELVQNSLHFIVEQLQPSDRLAIITFATDVSIDSPLTNADRDGKLSLHKVIDSIIALSSTNLFGGLDTAIQMVKDRTNANDVASILLFTDGIANIGVTKPDEIIVSVENKLGLIDQSCSLFTFGFGIAHDSNLLSELARRANGIYHFIYEDHEITDSFANCLGGLLTISSQNISIRLPSNVECISKFKKKTSDGIVTLMLGDMYAGEFRDIILQTKLESSETPKIDNFAFLITYLNVLNHEFESFETIGSLPRPFQVDPVKANYHLDKHRNRTEAAQCIMEAKNSAEENRFGEAKGILGKQIEKICSSISAEDPYCKSLLEDLVYLKGMMSDSKSYSLSGNKIINDFLMATTLQRSSATKSMKSIKSFTTDDKQSMIQKSHEYTGNSLVHQDKIKENDNKGVVKKNSFKMFFNNKKKEQETNTIGSWLSAIHLEQYEPNFIKNGYDDLYLLKFLDDSDFEALGIESLGHRLKIQNRANDLNIDMKKKDYENVDQWLHEIGLVQYFDFFEKGGYHELITIKLVEKENLEKLGIVLPGHIKKILQRSKQL